MAASLASFAPDRTSLEMTSFRAARSAFCGPPSGFSAALLLPILATSQMLHETAPHRSAPYGPTLVVVAEERIVLETLSEVGIAFTNERQLDPVLDRLLATALQVVRADAGSVMLLSRERDTLVVVAARGPRARTILGSRQPADRSVAGWALRAGE